MAKTSNWPKTSYNEFSKRMFICFMFAFFVQIVITICAECFFGAGGIAANILQICIPVYMTIFAAVIVKGGVENIFKGQTLTNFANTNSSTTTSDGDNG